MFLFKALTKILNFHKEVMLNHYCWRTKMWFIILYSSPYSQLTKVCSQDRNRYNPNYISTFFTVIVPESFVKLWKAKLEMFPITSCTAKEKLKNIESIPQQRKPANFSQEDSGNKHDYNYILFHICSCQSDLDILRYSSEDFINGGHKTTFTEHISLPENRKLWILLLHNG